MSKSKSITQLSTEDFLRWALSPSKNDRDPGPIVIRCAATVTRPIDPATHDFQIVRMNMDGRERILEVRPVPRPGARPAFKEPVES